MSEECLRSEEVSFPWDKISCEVPPKKSMLCKRNALANFKTEICFNTTTEIIKEERIVSWRK